MYVYLSTVFYAQFDDNDDDDDTQGSEHPEPCDRTAE